jgi:hypothetical protein
VLTVKQVKTSELEKSKKKTAGKKKGSDSANGDKKTSPMLIRMTRLQLS